jgi:hypothetical protein
MVVADARALPARSLARIVREQGLQWAKLQSEHDELQRENLDLRITIHDVAESLAALVAAMLPGCPKAAEGGLVPTAASIRDAAAQAASDAALSAVSIDRSGPSAASQVETTHISSSTAQKPERSEAEQAATTIQAAARGWSYRSLTSSADVPARVALADSGEQPEATRQVRVSEPDLGAIVSEMRDLASYVRQLPTDAAPTVGERPCSAPAQVSHAKRLPAAKGEGATARRPPMTAVPENCARPQSAPARHQKREQSIMGAADKEEARRAVLVARQSTVAANSWKHGLPAEHVPAKRADVHGGPRPASASSSATSRCSGSCANETGNFETGGVRQESEESWLARQPGGKGGHLSFVKSRIHNPVTLTTESDKQALREKIADAALAEPPVKWVAQGEGGWGHWTTHNDEAECTHCQDAVQISHSQSSSSRRPQSAPPSSSASRAQKVHGRRRGGSARTGKNRTSRRGIPPIFSEHGEDDNADADSSAWVKDAAAADSDTRNAVGWSERAEWKREQKKWSRLARNALRSMERD